MKYLGQWQADVVMGNAKIRLLHADGGMAYAVSYKAQKLVEQIPSGRKPQILFCGHWHTSMYFFYRNIHTFCAGCFEGQTTLLLRKQINPNIGGWIVTVRQLNDRKKTICGIVPEWIPFY